MLSRFLNTNQFVLFVITCLLALPLQAAFQDRGHSVRAQSMGGAAAAATYDLSSMLWNPAGTAVLTQTELSFVGGELFPGLTETNMRMGNIAFLIPSRRGSIGFTAATFKANGLLQEDMALLHYSRSLGQKLSGGLNLKYLRNNFLVGKSVNNAIFSNGTDEDAFTFDAGVQFKPISRLSLGLMGQNITEPDLGLASENKISARTQLGLVWDFFPHWLGALDLSYQDQDLNVHVGSEYWFEFSQVPVLGLRGGLNDREVAAGLAFNILTESSIQIRIDYAVSLYYEVENSRANQQNIGLSVLFF